jgi:hypothetical protein
LSKLYVDELQPKTSGGIIKNPQLPVATVSLTRGNPDDATDPYSPAQGTVIKFDQVLINRGNIYDPTTGRFTANQAGAWEFTGAFMTGTTTSTNHSLKFYKNGSTSDPFTTGITRAYNEVDGLFVMMPVNFVLELEKDDYITAIFWAGQLHIDVAGAAAYNSATFKFLG